MIGLEWAMEMSSGMLPTTDLSVKLHLTDDESRSMLGVMCENVEKMLKEKALRFHASEEDIRKDERQRIINQLRVTTLGGLGAEPTAGDSPNHAARMALLKFADVLMFRDNQK